jgi:uncharacterized membrane protein YdbT with pleckstrin-like domain
MRRAAMGYIDEKLMEGEQVVYRTKLHPAVLMLPIFFIVIAFVFFGPRGFGLFLAVLAGLWLAAELASHGTSEFGVTNKRILLKGGFIRRKAVDASLENVEGIQLTQSYLGRKLGYGTIVVRGNDGSSNSFSTINHALELGERVREQIERKKAKGTGR